MPSFKVQHIILILQTSRYDTTISGLKVLLRVDPHTLALALARLCLNASLDLLRIGKWSWGGGAAKWVRRPAMRVHSGTRWNHMLRISFEEEKGRKAREKSGAKHANTCYSKEHFGGQGDCQEIQSGKGIEGRKQSGEAAESVMETEQGWERCYRRRVFRKEAEKGGTANIGFLFSLEAFLVHPRGDLKPEDLVSVYGLHQGWADLRLV